jgi:hypothetical protein
MVQATVTFLYVSYQEIKGKLSNILPVADVAAARRQCGH